MPDEIADESLVEAVRRGDADAYAILWKRHADAARRAARAITSTFDPDDLVSESFASVLSAIRNGGGPTGAFRPYLFATIRNVAAMWGRKGRPLALDLLPDHVLADGAGDPFETMSERSTIAQVFKTLPPRHRTLLWYLEVEGMKAREIAPLMGLTPNAVSALSYRAREGFRQAWLQAHIADVARPGECRWFCERVVLQGKRAVARADVARFNTHLRTCRGCQIVAADIENVSRRLRAIVLPLVLGGAAATAYLADASGDVASAATLSTAELAGVPEVPVVTHAAGEGTSVFSGVATGPAETGKGVGGGVALAATLTVAGVVVAGAILYGVASALSTSPAVTASAPPRIAPGQSAVTAPREPSATPEAAPPRPSARPDEPLERAEPGPQARPTPLTVPSPTPPGSPDTTPEATPEPVPRPSPKPVPEPTPDPERQPPGFRFTNAITPDAVVPEILTGVGTPGATVTLVDENGVLLAEATVDAEGEFRADVSGSALHQGMSIRAIHTADGVVTRAPVSGPLTFPVPELTVTATSDPTSAAAPPGADVPDRLAECVRGVWIRLTGVADAWVSVAVDGQDPRIVQLRGGVFDDLIEVSAQARHLVTLQYADPTTGRRGLAVQQFIDLPGGDVPAPAAP